MLDSIFDEALRLQKKYQTRDPFELLDALNAVVSYTDAFPKDGLKGYCTIFNRIKYVQINAHLSSPERAVVAVHEAGHLIIHTDDLKVGAFQDNDIYNATGRKEREANFFGADFMIDDEQVLDLMHSCGANFFTVAKQLYVPAPFFAFKLYSMVSRGYAMRMPVELDSGFLAK